MSTPLAPVLRDYLVRYQQMAIRETGHRPATWLRTPMEESLLLPGCARPGYAFWQHHAWKYRLLWETICKLLLLHPAEWIRHGRNISAGFVRTAPALVLHAYIWMMISVRITITRAGPDVFAICM